MVAQRLTEGAQGDNRLNDVAWLFGVRAHTSRRWLVLYFIEIAHEHAQLEIGCCFGIPYHQLFLVVFKKKSKGSCGSISISPGLRHVSANPQSSYGILPSVRTNGCLSTYPYWKRSLHYCPCCFYCWAAGSTLLRQPLYLPC